MGHRLKIVFLDTDPALGSSRAGGADLDTVDFESLGEVTAYDSTRPDQLLQRAAMADVLVTNKVALGPRELEALPKLRLVSVLATGTDVVDLAAATAARVVVSNVPAYSSASAAQHALALLLELTNGVGQHSQDAKSGGWPTARAFSYWLAPCRELEGQTLGIAGFGAIGRRMARLGEALGMNVLVFTRSPSGEGKFVSKEELLRHSDVLSLHLPLTPSTRHFINETALNRVKEGALLVNVSRGGLVDSAAARRALESGRLGGIAVDVLEQEPPEAEDPLLGCPGAIVTPHMAWTSKAARTRLLEATRANIEGFAAGTPQNVVNPRPHT